MCNLDDNEPTRKYALFDTVRLKDGRIAALVDFIGPYYMVDVGDSPENWDSIEVSEEEIAGLEAAYSNVFRTSQEYNSR